MKTNINYNVILLAFMLCIVTIPEIHSGAVAMPHLEILDQKYQPITAYQNIVAQEMHKLFAKFYVFQKKYNEIVIDSLAKEIHKDIPQISREQAIEMIRHIMSEVFDPKSKTHVSIHLEMMKQIAASLDPVKDAKTIRAINFLIENQHKSSSVYLLFWVQKIKEFELKTAIPVTPEIEKKSDAEKLTILQKKLSASK